MLDFGKVPADVTLAAVWKDVSSILQRFGEEWLKENDLSEEELFKNLLRQDWDLWLATDGPFLEGIAVTRASSDEFRVLWAGGSGLEKYLLGGLYMFERYALARGIYNVTLGGRKGWEKLLAPLKYVPDANGLSKNIKTAYLH